MPLNLDGFLTSFNQQADERNRKMAQDLALRTPKKKTLVPEVKKVQPKSFKHYVTHPVDYLKDASQAMEEVNKSLPKPLSELMRFRDRAGDSASFGLMSEAQKKITGKEAYYLNDKGRSKGEKALDFGSTALGYVVPGAGAYKGLNAMKTGKALTQFGSKGLVPRLASEGAKGFLTGAAIGGAEVGVKELLNPDSQNWKDNLTHVGFAAGTGLVADPLLYGAGKALNLKGHANKLFADTGSTRFNEQHFKGALDEAFAPKGNPSKVLRTESGAPVNKVLSDVKPFEKRYDLPPSQKTFDVPTVDSPPILDDWFNYAQSGQSPKARGLVPKLNVSRGDKELIGNQAETILGRTEALKNTPDGGYNQRLLDIQKEMKTANDKRGIYRPELTPDELYLRTKKENDPATFDELIKLAEMEHNSTNAPKNLTSLLRNDSKVKESIQALNTLGGGKKPSIVPKPDVPKANFDEALNVLNDVKKVERPKDIVTLPNGNTVKAPDLNPKAVTLQTIRSGKDITKMSKEELQSVYEQLSKRQEGLKTSKKTNPKQLEAVDKDLSKVEKMLLRLDLQLFGENATRKLETVHGTLDSLDINNIKDISQFQVGTKNIYELANQLPKEQGDLIKNSLDTAKQKFVAHLEQETNNLYETIVKKLKIKQGSKESALVQDFGEKTLGKKYLRKKGIDPNEVSKQELEAANLEQLKKLYPNKWERIVEADQYFRKRYDELITQVNDVRKQIYPTNEEKIVPRRDDYYHHFNELTGLDGVKNLFDTPANIDPHLEGISPYTQPKSKFQGFMQKRMNGAYKSDAVGGFLKYIKAASHSINIDPVIPVLRNTARQLADATTESKNANKLIEALVDHANDLAGKTNPYDRLAQKVIGRKGMRLVTWANSRVKGNMILGNLGSLLGQLGSIPLGVGKAKLHSIPGIKNTLQQTTKELFHMEKTDPIYQSNFLKERFSDSLFRRFDQKLLQQPKRLAVWMMETADKAGTRFVWNSMYSKGVKKGVADPIKYADYETRKLIAGRGVGEVPLMQKSKTGQVLAPFTLEVGNQWKVLKDMVGEKDATGIITALVASYGLNRVMEQVRGSGVSFDPIDAIIDGYTRKNGDTADKTLNALASLNGEVVGNIPGGNLLTQMANTEKKVPLTDLKFKELFGERNPNRFGTGLTVAKAFEDPAYLLAPFGAAQFRKTTKGIDALRNEGVYKGDSGVIPFTGPKKELMYPITPGAKENAKLPFFGPSSVSTAKEYYDNKRRPLSEKQTAIYNEIKDVGGKNEQYYKDLMVQRRVNTIEEQIKAIDKDPNMSFEEKRNEILRLAAEIDKLKK